MAEKITNENYLYISAMLRAKEPKMLNSERIERILSAASFKDAAQVAVECGYADMTAMSTSEIEDAIEARKVEILAELSRLVPEKALVEAFRLKYDYHNAKVLVKSMNLPYSAEELLSQAGRVKPERLSEALSTDSYRFIPLKLGKAMQEAADTLAKTGNPQLADLELDRMYTEELLELAETLGEPEFALGYARMIIDTANLRTLIRVQKMGRDADYLRTVLIDGGSVRTVRLSEEAGTDILPELFRGTPLVAAAEAGAAVLEGGSLTVFEKACDDAMMHYLRDAKLCGYGNAVVIGYLTGMETELMDLRMLMTGLKTGISPETIRERLRETYV